MHGKQHKLTGVGYYALAFFAALCCRSAAAGTEGIQMLSDRDLSSIQGRDGVSFDLSGFSMVGDARVTYTAPTGATYYVGNLYASRSDDTSNPFSDPYTLKIVHSNNGLSDRGELSFPDNTNGRKVWQYAYDWGTTSNGIGFEGGSTILKDLVYRGGSFQFSAPRSGEGFGFGAALRMDIGNVLFRPRGRDDISVATPSTVKEQLNMSGVHLSAVDSLGNILSKPWRIADVETQPGVINAVLDDAGKPRLHIGIDWPNLALAPLGAPLGTLQIDNITFRSDTTGNLNLGLSRIGTMQIQYLDIKFKP